MVIVRTMSLLFSLSFFSSASICACYAGGYRIRHIPTSKPHVLIPNLLQRRFTASRPNEALVTDITYIRTWEGWLYLAIVLDRSSRRVVG